MRNLLYIATCSILCLLGGFFFLIQESWIVITSPFAQQQAQQTTQQKNTAYKTVTLYSMQNNNQIKKETTEIVYSDNTAHNIKLLLNSWLLFLEDEHIIEHENHIISVSLSSSKQEAFICLNQYPFEKSWSTYKKMMWIESLLKTIRENGISITSIRLLVQHQPLQDDHLHFELSWPIKGFIS